MTTTTRQPQLRLLAKLDFVKTRLKATTDVEERQRLLKQLTADYEAHYGE